MYLIKKALLNNHRYLQQLGLTDENQLCKWTANTLLAPPNE